MKKNINKRIAVSLALAVCLSSTVPNICTNAAESDLVKTTESADTEQPGTEQPGTEQPGTEQPEPGKPTEPEKPVLKGWQKTKSGKKQYYVDGVAVTGVYKIGKNWYYFDESGIMKTGKVKSGKTTYFLSDKGILNARKTGSTYYYANGKKMDKVAANDFVTLERAKKIVSEITNSKMSKKKKLRTCFDWVMAKSYRMRRGFKNTAGWPAVYANDHFKGGGGDCHSDAAAFAYLAKALGYKNVYVCCDSKGPGHSWAEINGKVYDPLFAQAKSFKKNYGVKYGVYRLSPILHIKI